MKKIPFLIKLLGGVILCAYIVTFAFSTYLNLFVRESLANSLSQILGGKVDINSFEIRFKEDLILTINGFEINSIYKSSKIFSAKKISSFISYSALFSGEVKINKLSVLHPKLYVQNFLNKKKNPFLGSYLKNIRTRYHINDSNRVTNLNKNTYGKFMPVNLRHMTSHSLARINLKQTTGNRLHFKIEEMIKKYLISTGGSITSVDVTHGRIIFSKDKPLFPLFQNILGSFRVRIYNLKKDIYDVKVDKLNITTERFRMVGQMFAENILSDEALIHTDLNFSTEYFVDGVKVKSIIPLKKIGNFQSLVKNINLTGSFNAKNLRVSKKIAKSRIPTIEMRFELRGGALSYNLAAMCPKGYAQKTKFTEGVATFQGAGSLKFKNKNHIILGINPHFKLKDCEFPDFFRLLNDLSQLKIFKEQDFVSTNVRGSATFIIDCILSSKEVRAQGSINLKDLILFAPETSASENPREVKIFFIPDNQTVFSWENRKLIFNTDVRFQDGDIVSHGEIDFTENDKKQGPWVDSHLTVNGFNLGAIKIFSRAISGILSSKFNIKGSINDFEQIFIDGSVKGNDLKLTFRGFQQEFTKLGIDIKTLSKREKIIRVDSINSKINNIFFPKLLGELRVFPEELRLVPVFEASIGVGRFKFDANIDIIKDRHIINFSGDKIKLENIEGMDLNGLANFSGVLW